MENNSSLWDVIRRETSEEEFEQHKERVCQELYTRLAYYYNDENLDPVFVKMKEVKNAIEDFELACCYYFDNASPDDERVLYSHERIQTMVGEIQEFWDANKEFIEEDYWDYYNKKCNVKDRYVDYLALIRENENMTYEEYAARGYSPYDPIDPAALLDDCCFEEDEEIDDLPF